MDVRNVLVPRLDQSGRLTSLFEYPNLSVLQWSWKLNPPGILCILFLAKVYQLLEPKANNCNAQKKTQSESLQQEK